MVLVTGAGGQAGKAVIKTLIKKRINVCAMVHRESQAEQMSEMGVKKTVVGDMMNPDDLRKALDGTDSIYFICSAGNPDEYKMGQIRWRMRLLIRDWHIRLSSRRYLCRIYRCLWNR